MLEQTLLLYIAHGNARDLESCDDADLIRLRHSPGTYKVIWKDITLD